MILFGAFFKCSLRPSLQGRHTTEQVQTSNNKITQIQTAPLRTHVHVSRISHVHTYMYVYVCLCANITITAQHINEHTITTQHINEHTVSTTRVYVNESTQQTPPGPVPVGDPCSTHVSPPRPTDVKKLMENLVF